MFLVFDVETTGLIKDNVNKNDFSANNLSNFPRAVQLAFQLHDEKGKLIQHYAQIVKPDGFEIPYQATQTHKITTERALKEGKDLNIVLKEFLSAIEKTKIVAGHNIIGYDLPVIKAELARLGIDVSVFENKVLIDTCTSKEVINFCQLKGGKGGGFKTPKLNELYQKLFGEEFDLAHNAIFDVHANTQAFFELLKREIIQIPNIKINPSEIEYEAPELSEIYEIEKQFHHITKDKKIQKKDIQKTDEGKIPFHFAYLHNHTIYSVGNSTTQIKSLVAKAAEYQASALAITDLGSMSGVIDFYNAIKSINKEITAKNEQLSDDKKNPTIKPIIGCEFYLCDDIKKENSKHSNYQIPIIAKSEIGYSNLCKLSSISYLEGFYYVPRIDKNHLLQYKQDLIVLSGWLYGEIPQTLLREGEQKAEEVILWYKENFQENFYLELNNHHLDEEKFLNDFLIKMAEKHNIKAIATHNNFYLDPTDADAFDILICIRNGELKEKPIGKGSGKRFGLPNNEFAFPSPQQIQQQFSFYPQAIQNAIELVNDIQNFSVEKNVALPKFDIPKDFAEKYSGLSEVEVQNEYLKHLAYEGAKKKYKEITNEIQERIDYELSVIAKMGFPGYFLIISDFLNESRKKGIRIGPGRGSAAGSIIAYCLDITNVDPIKYNLLFERFLNPDRISMPDIDIDIADDRRDEVIDYVVQKYGKDKVANIITFSSLKVKSAIRDVARVLGIQPSEVNKIAQAYSDLEDLKIPPTLFATPEKIDFSKFVQNNESPEILKQRFNKLYQQFIESHPKAKEVLENAIKVDGCLRHTGKHACGVIIAPKSLDEITPLAKDTKTNQVITQLDVEVAEKAGLLKMDFLGLTTLSIITNTLQYIKENKGIEIDIDNIPLNDEKTFEIFKNGFTDEIFQFESPGMKKYLQQLKPDNINDLVAMNALYRPGPMKYIDSYIKRKHGIEKIEYPFPEMEEILKETYGITVYQEQVMLLSQKLAGFTKAQADELRKAMGKKNIAIIEKLEKDFLEGCAKNGFDLEKVKVIWEDWKDFASYAFNKSHAVCYAILAYQTAYLKAHYPSEFMCAALNTKSNIEDIASVLTECRRMNIKILPPDINESVEKFSVNQDGNIRFGLSFVKNVGANFAAELIENRKQKGAFKNIFELAERLSSKVINKKNIENLAMAGAFDSLTGIHRSMFFIPASDGLTLTEKLSKFAESQQKKQTLGSSLFDMADTSKSLISQYPEILPIPEWDINTKLLKEKEVIGLFISGTPLDQYKLITKSVPNIHIKNLTDALNENPKELQNKNITLIGWSANAEERTMKNGKNYYNLKLEDHTGNISLFISDEMAEKSKLKYHLNVVKCYLIKGKVENRKFSDNDNDRWELRVNDIFELDNILSQKSELRILLNIKDIQLNLIKELEKIFKTNGGVSVPVKLIITDEERKNYVSTTNVLKINFDELNLKILEDYHLEYKLVINE